MGSPTFLVVARKAFVLFSVAFCWGKTNKEKMMFSDDQVVLEVEEFFEGEECFLSISAAGGSVGDEYFLIGVRPKNYLGILFHVIVDAGNMSKFVSAVRQGKLLPFEWVWNFGDTAAGTCANSGVISFVKKRDNEFSSVDVRCSTEDFFTACVAAFSAGKN